MGPKYISTEKMQEMFDEWVNENRETLFDDFIEDRVENNEIRKCNETENYYIVED